jgi:hypothetical protein
VAEIPRQHAGRRALERLIKVLRAELEDELALLNDTGNDIPLPGAYHMLGLETDIAQILTASRSACFVYPAEPTLTEAKRTGDGTQRGQIDKTLIRVVILFRAPAGIDPAMTFDGQQLTRTEAIWQFADRLRGAALLVLYRHAPNADDIHAVEVLANNADVILLNNNDLTGRAILDVEVTQNVLVPQALWSLP